MMLFRLALALGRTVEELDTTLSPDEFAEWQAYYAFEPWGTPAEDQRASLMNQLLYAPLVDPKRPKPIPNVFLFDRDPDETRRARRLREEEEFFAMLNRMADDDAE